MPGTKEGAAKTRDKVLKENPNFYKEIGVVGGRNGKGHTFAHGKVDPTTAGAKGGRNGKRGASVKV